jgi:pantoate--beta-alanine ligase
MVSDLNLDLEIVGYPTVREHDGLAMSSRNKYLSPTQRKSAPVLFQSLQLAEKMFSRGERHSSVIIQEVEKLIKKTPETQIDYIKICDTASLKDVRHIKNKAVIALAVKIGATRLIDNHVFGEELKI